MLAALLPALLLLAIPALHPGTNATLSQYARLVEVRSVALSPDARSVSWSQSINDQGGAAPDLSSLWLLDLGRGGAAPVRVSACAAARHGRGCDEGAQAFSPDGTQLAFLSDAKEKHQPQLYLRDVASGRTRKLTSLEGALSDVRFSPDGKSVAVLFVEGDASAAGPLGPSAANVGVMQETIHERRIAVIDLATAKVSQVSPPDLFVYEYDWSPDGASFAFSAAHGSGDDNWWVAELFTQPAAGGPATSIAKPTYQLATPRWSPDGATIAYIGGLMSDEGLTGGDVYLVARGGGEPRNLTKGRKSSPGFIQWVAPDSLLFAEWANGDSVIATLRVSDGAVTEGRRAQEHVGTSSYALSLAASRDGSSAALVRHRFDAAPELWMGPLTGGAPLRQLTHLNEGIKPAWGAVQSLHWKSDSFDEQGFLLAPAQVEPGKKYPMITVVHGGPAYLSSPGFGEVRALLAARGYYVFLPNPRGSFGQGEAYTAANVKDFGGGDLRDVLAGVDAALQAAPIDANRLGLFGWSYGGFMTMWAVTQTQRFHAAVAGAGIANWQSYYGENKIDQWMIPYFGASVYDDPAVYAKATPLNFIKAAKTPTLILHGERDAEVPAPQGLEFWHALKSLGVPTQLVIYEGEGHAFHQTKNKRDMYERLVAWFDRYLR